MKKNSSKPMGRPPKIVADAKTLQTLVGCARIQCTQEEAAAVLGVHRQTLRDFLAKDKKASDAWESGLDYGRASLRRTQFRLAETNAGMAIWLGKQLLGQREQIMQEHTHAVNLNEVRSGIQSKLARLAAGIRAASVPVSTH